jgi:hypothetical protein
MGEKVRTGKLDPPLSIIAFDLGKDGTAEISQIRALCAIANNIGQLAFAVGHVAEGAHRIADAWEDMNAYKNIFPGNKDAVLESRRQRVPPRDVRREPPPDPEVPDA